MTASYRTPHRPAPANLLATLPPLTLPLEKGHSVSGDAGSGPSAPGFLPTDAGIVLTRRGCISLFTPELSRELWRVGEDDWSNDTLVDGDVLLHGVVEGKIKEFSLRDGHMRHSFPYELARIVGAQNDIFILTRDRYVDAADRSGQRLWSVEIAPGGVVAHAGELLYASAIEPFCRALLAIEVSTGEVAWRREIPAEGTGDAAMMSSTISTVAVVGERVLVIPQDGGRLFDLSSENGTIQSITPLPSLPPVAQHFVTATEIIAFHPFAVSFFDHRTMRETRRLDLRDDVEPLYEGRAPFSHGACLIGDGVIWTTPHGAFMGVTLAPAADGRRTTWLHEIPGALMPRDIPPVVHDGRVYYTNMGDPLELICFAPAHE